MHTEPPNARFANGERFSGGPVTAGVTTPSDETMSIGDSAKSHLGLFSKACGVGLLVLASIAYAAVSGSDTIEAVKVKWSREHFGYLFVFAAPLFFMQLLRSISGLSALSKTDEETKELHDAVSRDCSWFNPYYGIDDSTALIGMANRFTIFCGMLCVVSLMAVLLRDSSVNTFRFTVGIFGLIVGKLHYRTFSQLFALDKRFLDIDCKPVPDGITPLIAAIACAIAVFFVFGA